MNQDKFIQLIAQNGMSSAMKDDTVVVNLKDMEICHSWKNGNHIYIKFLMNDESYTLPYYKLQDICDMITRNTPHDFIYAYCKKTFIPILI